jgi:integrase
MSRTSKPWWRKDRQAWFVTINGQRHNLGPDREQAFQQFHRLMAQAPVTPAPTTSVVAIMDTFLEWTDQHRAQGTYRWYHRYCQSFAEAIPGDLAVACLKPFHLQQWLDQHPTWAPGNRRGAITAIQRAFRWAEKMGHIDRSPIAYVEKPKAGKREGIVAPEEYQQILAHIHDDVFADIVTTAWETGCRPQEIVHVQQAIKRSLHNRTKFGRQQQRSC